MLSDELAAMSSVCPSPSSVWPCDGECTRPKEGCPSSRAEAQGRRKTSRPEQEEAVGESETREGGGVLHVDVMAVLPSTAIGQQPDSRVVEVN